MKKALNKWCLPPGMSIREAVELCAKIGYDGLELNIEEEGELNWQTPLDKAKEFAVWSAEASLELPSISTALHWRYPITSADPNVRAKGMAVARKQIEVARAIGADTILLVVGLVTKEDPYDAVWERAASSVRELARFAAERQVHIGVENVGNRFLLSPTEMRTFIDAIDSPWVGAYFDVGNVVSLGLGWPEQWIRILGSRILKVHVKDHLTAGQAKVGVPLLAGNTIDWLEVVKALQEVGYDSYLIAEISPYAFYPTKLAYDTLVSLDILLGRPVGSQPLG
jgi:L-ribulose-5-phosphate 3-epimerase